MVYSVDYSVHILDISSLKVVLKILPQPPRKVRISAKFSFWSDTVVSSCHRFNLAKYLLVKLQLFVHAIKALKLLVYLKCTSEPQYCCEIILYTQDVQGHWTLTKVGDEIEHVKSSLALSCISTVHLKLCVHVSVCGEIMSISQIMITFFGPSGFHIFKKY